MFHPVVKIDFDVCFTLNLMIDFMLNMIMLLVGATSVVIINNKNGTLQ